MQFAITAPWVLFWGEEGPPFYPIYWFDPPNL